MIQPIAYPATSAGETGRQSQRALTRQGWKRIHSAGSVKPVAGAVVLRIAPQQTVILRPACSPEASRASSGRQSPSRGPARPEVGCASGNPPRRPQAVCGCSSSAIWY